MSFDPLNILLLAIALVVFWRLRSALGTRTGTEKPPLDPFETKRIEPSKHGEPQATVVRFPQGAAEEPAQRGIKEEAQPIWTGFAEPGSDLADALERIAEADTAFMPRSFVEGATLAYEMVVEAFAKGEKAELKNLLSKEVYEGFARAIDEREAEKRKVELRFVGVDKAVIRQAALEGSRAAITMQFVSEQITATYSASGDVVDGDPKQIREVTDVWTFERDVNSRNPNWKLVATQAPA